MSSISSTNTARSQSARRVALLGAPNCGKTVLFNGLTGLNAKVANYPGVTVDRREGALVGDSSITIIDLPGTYSLRAASPDEAVAPDVVLGRLGEPPDALVAVADATNLRMTVRMVLELKTLGLPLVVSLNLSDVAYARGQRIDAAKLSELLGVPVLETVAVSRAGIAAVRQAVCHLPHTDQMVDGQAVEQRLHALDSQVLYDEAEAILAQVVQAEMQLPAWHRRVDAVVMHPVWGMLLLLLVLLLVFQAVYAWAEPLMTLIEEDMMGGLGAWVAATLPEGLLRDLLVDGIIAGVGSVLVFLPQITILFAFILLLEDSGYLPRAAYLLDNLLARTGLSGRSFIPLLSSFACAVPAVMSARTIQDPRERLVTIAVAPMLTCSARLPVYALIIAAVIPERDIGIFNLQGLTLFALYVLGVVSVAGVAWILKWFARRSGQVQQFPLLMELPTYRMPHFRHILASLWDRVKAFLLRAGTVIFAISVVLWALVSFPAAPDAATHAAMHYSFAGQLGQLIQPLFAPLGFTWQMCIAMIPGLAAREVVVAALGTVYAVSGDGSEDAVQEALIPVVASDWGLPTAFAFLVWYVYAPMCLATLAVIRRETKSARHTALIASYLLVLAYVGAWITYRISSTLLA